MGSSCIEIDVSDEKKKKKKVGCIRDRELTREVLLIEDCLRA